MPPLLIPSPAFLDQSFPRSEEELQSVSIALSALVTSAANEECGILATQALKDFVEQFDWDRGNACLLLSEIYRLIAQLLLQPNDQLFELETTEISAPAHPAPASCKPVGLLAKWTAEVGRVFYLHSLYNSGPKPHIGVACALAFSDQPKDSYATEREAFPLVGPKDVGELDDAFDWITLADIHRKKVSFALAHKNCHVLGAIEVATPSNSSHYIVKFKGQRSWPLDYNTDPIPERFLGQLKSITGYPIGVIKHILITGRVPDKKLKIPLLRNPSSACAI